MNRPSYVLTLAAALVLYTEGDARAEFVRFSYSYHAVSYPSVDDTHPTTVSVRIGSDETRSAEAELGAGMPLLLAPLRLETDSTLSAGLVSPGEVNDHTAFFFHLTDLVSGKQAHFMIPGDLSGLVGPDSSTMVLRQSTGRGYVEARLGGYVYRVSLPDVPVPPWSAGGVEFTPQLTVSAASSSEQTPEPSTLALSAAAALGLAGRWLRRRRPVDLHAASDLPAEPNG